MAVPLMLVFWVAMLCGLVVNTTVLEKHTISIFGAGIYLQARRSALTHFAE
jgi:hypothetical protein